MKRSSGPIGFVLGALFGLLVASVFHLGSRAAGLPFAPFDVFEVVTRILPGAIVGAGIDLMVAIIRGLGIGPTSAVAKLAEQAMAVVMFVSASAVLGALVALAGKRVRAAGAAAGFVLFAIAAASEIALHVATVAGIVWLACVLAGWSVAIVVSLERSATSMSRRRFVGGLAGAVAAASSVLLGVAALFRRASNEVGAGELTSAPAGRIAPVPGTRAELTPNDRFYRIDIDLAPPRIDAASWKLRVEGLVDEPLDLSLDRIRAMPPASMIATLACISNPVGGDLISTTRWTGVRLRDVLRLARARDGARAVEIDAADGFYESVSMADANDDRTLLVYAMNDVPLAAEHGFPLRIIIPNRYGMKQPKWIRRLRVIDNEGRGYWVERGWNREATVQTTSVIDRVQSSMMIGTAKALPIGGIAYAGARGISKVEVQVDDGPWTEATLVAPPLSALTWVLWRYDWPYSSGKHTFRVRAYDGTGALQPTRERGPHPDGATGIHSVTMTV
jgi:DMSO/TMAO reductase YedYZ molybdopterin-dependent catalytic subunit